MYKTYLTLVLLGSAVISVCLFYLSAKLYGLVSKNLLTAMIGAALFLSGVFAAVIALSLAGLLFISVVKALTASQFIGSVLGLAIFLVWIAVGAYNHIRHRAHGWLIWTLSSGCGVLSYLAVYLLVCKLLPLR